MIHTLRVTGKIQLLFRVAEAVVEEPEGTIRDVLFPRVKEETSRDLAVVDSQSVARVDSLHPIV